MSGFVAVINFDRQPVAPDILNTLVEGLRYRGPHRQETWIAGHVGMGHTLLRSLHEHAHDQQPLCFDDGSAIVADARIDGRAELITELRAKGCTVADTAPSVELIMHAYQVWGTRCVEHLIGDFSFVIWDGTAQRVFCARDQIGVRALYYAYTGHTLVIANETRAVLEHPLVPDAFDELAIAGFLTLGRYSYIDKSITTFAAIRRVPPASQLIAAASQLAVTRYWEFPLDVPLLRYRDERSYLEHFHHLLSTAIADRLQTDQAFIFFSGGMDSTTVASMAVRVLEQRAAPTRFSAFTLGYQHVSSDQEFDYADQAANALGLPIHHFALDQYKLLDPYYPQIEPTRELLPAMTRDWLSKQTEFGYVGLSGRIGDNLLGLGRLNHTAQTMGWLALVSASLKLYRFFGAWPRNLGLKQYYLSRQRTDPAKPAQPYPVWLNPDFEQRTQIKEVLDAFWRWQPEPKNRRHPSVHKWVLVPDWQMSFEYRFDDTPTPAEVTDPFMDLRLLDFILSLLPLPWFYDKYLYRRAGQRILPQTILNRRKTAFGSPLRMLLPDANRSFFDHWSSAPGLDHYVVRDAVPPLQADGDQSDKMVNIRPLLLNLWLTHRT